MNATRMFWPSASSPFSVDELSANGCPFATRSPLLTIGRWLMQVPWFERTNLRSCMTCSTPSSSTTMIWRAVTLITSPSAGATHHLTGIHRYLALDARADNRRLWPEQRHRLALHVRAHQRAVHVVMLQERNQRGGARSPSAWRDIHVVHRGDLTPGRSRRCSAPTRDRRGSGPRRSSGAFAWAMTNRSSSSAVR